jgi:hypothetical protein
VASSPFATLEEGGHVSHCRVPFDHRLHLHLLYTLCDGLCCHSGGKHRARSRDKEQVHDFGIGKSNRPNIALPMCCYNHFTRSITVELAVNGEINQYSYSNRSYRRLRLWKFTSEIGDLSLLVHASPCRSLTSTRRVLLEHCIASLFTLSIVTNCLVTIILTPGT